MDGGAAAAHVVVVHCGEIVVDEAVGVEAFERGADGCRGGEVVRPAGAGAFDDEKRAETLAAAQQRMARRLHQPGWAAAVRLDAPEGPGQDVIGRCGGGPEAVGKAHHVVHPCRFPTSNHR